MRSCAVPSADSRPCPNCAPSMVDGDGDTAAGRPTMQGSASITAQLDLVLDIVTDKDPDPAPARSKPPKTAAASPTPDTPGRCAARPTPSYTRPRPARPAPTRPRPGCPWPAPAPPTAAPRRARSRGGPRFA